MISFFKKYKPDITGIICWLLVFILLTVLTWGKWGSPIIDSGRELYIAEHILQGQTLYTDLYYCYNPLSILIFCLLFSLFGIHLNIAYICGIVVALLSLVMLYSISRLLLPVKISVILIILIILQYCFNASIFNYIFPYTYSALFSSLFSFIYILSLQLHIKKGENKFLLLAGLCAGLSTITKIEYGFACDLSLILYLFLNLKNFENIKSKCLNSLLPMFLLPIITFFIILWHSGVKGLLNHIEFTKLFFTSEAGKYYLINSFGLNNFFTELFINLPSRGLIVLVTLILINLVVYILLKYNIKELKKIILVVIASFALIFICFKFAWPAATIISFFQFKQSMVILIPLVCLIFSIYWLIRHFYYHQNLSSEQKMLLLIASFTVLLTLRCFFYVDMFCYAIFYTPLSLVMLFYLIYNYTNSINNFNYFWRGNFVVIYIIFLSFGPLGNYLIRTYPIRTDRGTIYTTPDTARPINQLLQIIKTQTKENDYIVLAPQETLVYFLSNRSSATMFVDYPPFRIVSNSLEHYFIDSIKHKNVKLIAISSLPTPEYLYNYWGYDYNQKLFHWIKKYYNLCYKLNTNIVYNPNYKPYEINVYQKSCSIAP